MLTRECRTCLAPVQTPHTDRVVYCALCWDALGAPETPAYLALLARATELRLPVAFADDLTVHDRVSCFRRPGPFAWAIGPGGTWLGHKGARLSVVPTIKMMFPHLHVWDGARLHVVTSDELRAFLTTAEVPHGTSNEGAKDGAR
jgi:hypothetical protein